MAGLGIIRRIRVPRVLRRGVYTIPAGRPRLIPPRGVWITRPKPVRPRPPREWRVRMPSFVRRHPGFGPATAREAIVEALPGGGWVGLIEAIRARWGGLQGAAALSPFQYSQRGAPYLYGEIEGLGQAWTWRPRIGTTDRTYFDAAAEKGDCAAIRSITLQACRRAGGGSECLQYATDNERICKAAAPAIAPAAPPAPTPVAMPAMPMPAPSPTMVRVETRTPGYEIEIEMPQADRGVYVPPPTRMTAPPPDAAPPPPPPRFITYGFAPANSTAAMYQPPSPKLPPARIDAEEQRKILEAEEEAKPKLGAGALVLLGVGLAMLMGQ